MFDLLTIKIINIAHQVDRKNECLQELKKINTEMPDLSFFPAKYVEDCGERGCALSHAMALSEFLYTSDNPFALILEDDFAINNPDGFEDSLLAILTHSKLWNVYVLGHRLSIPIESSPVDNTMRVINATTTSGYLVGRLYASKLIESFFRSAQLLKEYEHLPPPNKQITAGFVCADILWKKLQINDIFWASFPPLVHQRKSYSDIRNKVIDYGP